MGAWEEMIDTVGSARTRREKGPVSTTLVMVGGDIGGGDDDDYHSASSSSSMNEPQ